MAAVVLFYAPAGEMGGTIITHPGSYLQAISSIKAKWTSAAALKAGVAFFGGFTPGQINRGPGGGRRHGCRHAMCGTA
jgi:hypothetical protein